MPKLRPLLLSVNLRLFGLLVIAVAAAIGVALGATSAAMSPSGPEMIDLALLLVFSAAVSLSAFVALQRALRTRALAGARARIAATALFGGVLALANVSITAAFMFLSSHDLTLLLVLIGFALFVSTLLATAVARSIAEPVTKLAQAVDELDDSYAIRVDVDGPTEIAHLAVAFNQMVERLGEAASERERLEAARLNLITAISHDLRTPISGARLRLEAIADGLVEIESQPDYLSGVRSDLDRLSRLIDDLFEVARIESGAIELTPVPTDLAVLAAEVVEGVRPQASEKDVELESFVHPGLGLVELDPWSIERALGNLLQNAVHYTPAGGNVRLDVAPKGSERVEFVVHDTGCGVAPAEAERIFEPLFRSDAARMRDGAGAGLGLAIARGLVQAHGGNLGYEPAQGQGSIFRISLPVHSQLLSRS